MVMRHEKGIMRSRYGGLSYSRVAHSGNILPGCEGGLVAYPHAGLNIDTLDKNSIFSGDKYSYDFPLL